MDFTSTPYKISTITATGSLNSLLNLDELYDKLEVNDNIIYIEYGSSKSSSCSKGENPKVVNRKRRNNKVIKRFDNQITLILADIGNDELKAMYTKTNINAKVFRNGNVQMTGLKSEKQGKECMNYISHIVKMYCNNEVFVSSYNIQLINSDYRINRNINRNKLNNVINNNFDIMSLFEPCIYPGVKVKYYWNNDKDSKKDGCCYCCYDKDCTCKKITIAVFQSGCIIITGAQMRDQIDEAYVFFNNILKKYDAEVCTMK
jgi:TATA-box binding protein (TBP) (component of TFIID and TFIIIB)